MSEIAENMPPTGPAAPSDSAASATPAPGAASSTPGRSIPADSEQRTPLEHGVIAILKTVYDPEIPVDIYELGLIYDLRVNDAGHVDVDMTLTSPMCPVAGTLPGEVKERVESVTGVTSAEVNVVWEPPWDMAKMSEAAKLRLNVG